MADLENRYYEVDGSNAQAVTSKRWFQVGVAFTVAFTVGYAATSSSRTAEPINLLGRIASPQVNAQQVLSALGDSPFKKPALLAIEAMNSQGRDVSTRATADKWNAAMKTMDVVDQDKVAKARAQVAEIAKTLPGNMAPTGFWDPVGFSSRCTLGTLLFWREAELKHGRIGMIATLGIIMGEKFAPLIGAAKDVPAALQMEGTVLQAFWPAVFLLISFPEITKKDYSYSGFGEGKFGWQLIDEEGGEKLPEGIIPGDYGFDPLGLKPKDAKAFVEIQNKELNNGRLAMLAAIGIVAQEISTGQKVF